MKKIINFFEEIIKHVVFKNTNNYGDAAIREAFASCLYNQATTVDDIHFYYEYNKKRKEGHLEYYYQVHFVTFLQKENVGIVRDVLSVSHAAQFKFDKYSDKRLYKKLLEEMDEYLYSPVAVNTILDSAEKAGKYYNLLNPYDVSQKAFPVTSDEHVRRALQNIEKVCKKNKAQNTQLFRNVKRVSRMRP